MDKWDEQLVHGQTTNTGDEQSDAALVLHKGSHLEEWLPLPSKASLLSSLICLGAIALDYGNAQYELSRLGVGAKLIFLPLVALSAGQSALHE